MTTSTDQAPTDRRPAGRCGDMFAVSAYTGVPVNTLRHWRVTGSGPKSYKVGGRVLYDFIDVDAWLDERKAASA